jgi:hypothetical protein
MEASVQASPESEVGDFWRLLNVGLRLQHSATRHSACGELEQAAECERRAIAVLLEATCCLEPDDPALVTVRQLALAGMSRLRTIVRRSQPPMPRTRGRRVLAE